MEPAGTNIWGEQCWSWPVQLGPLPQGWGPFPHNRPRSPIEEVLSAEVRLHALVGKKDGQTITPNEEMKLDCQDLSELVLTRCRLFKCLCVIC